MFDIPFHPHPLFRGGHLQTIVGSYWKDNCRPVGTQQHILTLADGDRLVLHVDQADVSSAETSQSPTTVLLVHGLGGCHASGYVRRVAFKLNQRGVRTFRLDLRGHGAGMELAQAPGHAGRSEDVNAAIAWIGEHYPSDELVVIGFSLGANIVLKMAGEWGNEVPAAVKRILAVAPPVELQSCSAGLRKGLNRFYDRMFVRAVMERVQRLVAAGTVPGPIPSPFPPTLRDFDNVYTSIRSGFQDVEDYYTQASSLPLLPRISLPATIVAAKDDPIVPSNIFHRIALSPTTQLIMTRHGGHLGYLSGKHSDPDRHWLDWRIVDWVMNSSPATSSHKRSGTQFT